MTKPVRLQLKRTKGFRLQEASQAANGLPAVIVGRPTKWGNPYRVKIRGRFHDGTPAWAGAHDQEINYPMHRTQAEAAERAVSCFKDRFLKGELVRIRIEEVTNLAGKNLACWCDLSMPCHADVLLRLANPEEVSNVQG